MRVWVHVCTYIYICVCVWCMCVCIDIAAGIRQVHGRTCMEAVVCTHWPPFAIRGFGARAMVCNLMSSILSASRQHADSLLPASPLERVGPEMVVCNSWLGRAHKRTCLSACHRQLVCQQGCCELPTSLTTVKSSPTFPNLWRASGLSGAWSAAAWGAWYDR